MYSTVTGKEVEEGEELDGGYWMRNLREGVRFWETVAEMRKAGYDTLVELSPHPTLTVAMEETLERVGMGGVVVGSLRREQAEREALLEGLGALYTRGCPVEWNKVQCGGRPPVPLPRYPWQHERFWIDRPAQAKKASAGISEIIIKDTSPHHLLGHRLNIAGPDSVYLWQATLSRSDIPWVADHRVYGAAVLPAAAYIEMALAAAHQIHPQSLSTRISDFRFHRVLVISDSPSTIQTSAIASAEHVNLEIHSWDEQTGAWVLHSSAVLSSSSVPSAKAPEFINEEGESASIDDLYKRLAGAGLEYGTTFRCLQRLTIGQDTAIGQVSAPSLEDQLLYHAFPPILDCALQTVAALAEAGHRSATACLPVAIDRVEFERDLPAQYTAMGAYGAHTQKDGVIKTDIMLLDHKGLIATIQGLSLLRVDEAATRRLNADRADVPAISLFELQWREQQLPSRGVESQPLTWLIFTPKNGVGPALASLVEQTGGRAIKVSAAMGYGKISDHEYNIRACAEEDIRLLLAETETSGAACIVYCAGFCGEAGKEPDADRLQQGEIQSATTLALVAKSILDRDGKYRIWVATAGTQNAARQSEHRLCGSSLWGVGRVIANEHPEQWGGLVDLDAAASPLKAARVLQEEILGGNGENQIAYRRGRRFVARFATHQSNAPASPVRFHPDGVYLITGGTGALGTHVARWMADRGARKLLLISRRAPTDRTKWNEVHADVEFAEADVADERAVRAVLDRYRNGCAHQIRGVIHAAGILADRTIAEIEASSFAQPFLPKVAGAWVLHQYFRETPLDFFVLFSSAASVFGSPGQAAYSAANAFMDALAHHRCSQGLPGLSINWGAWGGGGLATANEPSQHLEALGLSMMETAPALASLEVLLNRPLAQAVAVSLDWERFRLSPFFSSQAAIFSEISPAWASRPRAEARSSLMRGPLLAANDEGRRRMLEDLMQAELARVLRIQVSRARLDVPLTRLGVDSLMAVSFRSAIERSTGILIPMQQLLRSESLSNLVVYALGNLPRPSAEEESAQEEASAEYEIVRF